MSLRRWSGVLVGIAAATVQPALVKVLERVWRDVVFSVKTEDRVVALTIDDGPSSVTTDLLALLAHYDAHATFFLLGKKAEQDAKKGRESALQQIVGAGHELGNHTWCDRSTYALSQEELEDDLGRTHRVLSLFGTVRVFRPGGARFHPRMLTAAAEVAKEAGSEYGYECILASVYPHDVRVPFPRFIVWYVTRLARRGSIIVLHEGEGERARVVRVLEEVLCKLRDDGYRVTTVSDLLRLRTARGSKDA